MIAGTEALVYLNYGIAGITSGMSLIIFGIGFAIGALPFVYSSQKKIDLEKERDKLEKAISVIQKKTRTAGSFGNFTAHIGQFSDLWDDFRRDSQEYKANGLFEALKRVLNSQAICRHEILQLVSEEQYKEIYSVFTKNALSGLPVYGDIAYLYLMDSICRLLINSPLSYAWNNITCISLNEIIERPGKIEPWKSIGFEYPGNSNDYVEFFKFQKSKPERLYMLTL